MVRAGNQVLVGSPWLRAFAPLPVGQERADVRISTPPSATVVSTFLLLSGVWLSAAGLSSGAAAAWAWWREEDVQASAADGAAIGFIYGLPVTACAAIMLICGI